MWNRINKITIIANNDIIFFRKEFRYSILYSRKHRMACCMATHKPSEFYTNQCNTFQCFYGL